MLLTSFVALIQPIISDRQTLGIPHKPYKYSCVYQPLFKTWASGISG
jgi:hypothetical protein